MLESIVFDFDGVIIDSMSVRDAGFIELFNGHPQELVDKLLEFHRNNGGLSRYVKIKYFFEQLLQTQISDEGVNQYAERFSSIMRMKLINPDLLIEDTLNFIKIAHTTYKLYIVSGSDEQELRYLCNGLTIDQYFKGIWGSPTPKSQIIEKLIKDGIIEPRSTILIGDSINDLDAATEHKITFVGYNNDHLSLSAKLYLKSFDNFSCVVKTELF